MTFNFLGPGLTVNVEAKVKEQIILDSSDKRQKDYLFTANTFALVKIFTLCNLTSLTNIK